MFVGAAFSCMARWAFEATLTFSKVIILIVVMVIAVIRCEDCALLLYPGSIRCCDCRGHDLKGHLVQGRLTGIFEGNYSDPNDLALAFVISIPLCLALFFLTRIGFGNCLGFNNSNDDLWDSLTGSRGGFLALIVTAAVCLWEFAIRGRRTYLLILLPVMGVILAQSSGEMITSRLKGTLDVNDNTASSYESSQQRQGLFGGVLK